MNTEEKKGFLLLKSVIFHYHGLDYEEQKKLEDSATTLDAKDELQWANRFISQDYYTAFDRARKYLKDIMGSLSKEKKLSYLESLWKEVCEKGYITEMEAAALLKVAKDWDVEMELITLVKETTASALTA